jgi:hypothetical protein
VKKTNKNIPWNTVKESLANKDSKELLLLVKDLYSLNQDNKTFIQTKYSLIDPIKPYKEIIEQSLYPDPIANDPISLSNGRKAISRYRKAVGDPNGILELMVYYVECGNQLTVEYGDIDEKFYNSLESMFVDVLEILSKCEQETVNNYLPRLRILVDKAKGIGWGYYDNMSDYLFEAFGSEDE